MSQNNFISFLQQLLTMVEPGNDESFELAKRALETMITLARYSKKVDAKTNQMMTVAEARFINLVENASIYVGKPGEFIENSKRRRRLEMSLYPHC